MVDMAQTNTKLRARAATMVSELAGVGPDAAAAALTEAGGAIKLAILLARGWTGPAALSALSDHHGRLGDVLDGNAAAGSA